jgi:hypothetical protein
MINVRRKSEKKTTTKKKTIEVELKFSIKKKHEAKIVRRLLKRRCRVVPTMQTDTYLNTPDPRETLRVRKQRTTDGVEFFRTSKRKCKLPKDKRSRKSEKMLRNTNNEKERDITERRHDHLVRTKRMTAFGKTVYLRKRRVHFYDLVFRGYKITIALDKAWGPDDIKLGRRVEFEVMVETCGSVKGAKAAMRALAREDLPKGVKREFRGYRTLVLQALAKRAGKKYKKGKPGKVTEKTTQQRSKKPSKGKKALG